MIKLYFLFINYYLFIYQFTFLNKIKIDINIYIDLYQQFTRPVYRNDNPSEMRNMRKSHRRQV